MLFEEINICEVTRNHCNNYYAGFGWQNNNYDCKELLQFGYISGFKEAADTVVNNMIGVNDALMFPVFFCYRQYLELLLKNIYRLGLRDDVRYKKDIKFTQHQLKPLWERARKYVKAYINNYYNTLTTEQKDKFLSLFENTIFLFHSLDEKSFNFRYPENKELEQSIKQDYVGIDFLEMQKLIESIDDVMYYSYDHEGMLNLTAQTKKR